MNAESRRRCTASLERCMTESGFLERFYELFLASSPEVRERFTTTNFERQRRALSSSLVLMVLALDGGAPARAYMDQVAERHSRGALDIPPAMYDGWLDCLMLAAREFDPQFDDALEQDWRATLAEGIALMRARY
jgi:hemoglobin-like flavoprotein